ncbi:transmembrane 97 [Rhizoctonia solani]|uniref:Transmembrane 97 n=1 Tax=Rhizoctonia solani TaxID=456999 RepID=A0A8H8NX67_9AGAM|nr:transmembrane 97 [Rhizoctonia solani]QRW20280.1 transmembrane 97 [Rhizoctonia solani]
MIDRGIPFRLFQLPVFFLGLYALKKATPIATIGVPEGMPFASVSTLQLAVLLASYIPFLAVPLAMTIDGTRRMAQIVSHAQRLEKLHKSS